MSSGFHEVSFPMTLAFGATSGLERQNEIALLSNGFESRNARWRNARRRFDAGLGIKSAQDLYKLVAFFEARHGSLYGFRFKDPIDHLSCEYGQAVSSIDQQICVGDGLTNTFQLLKTYGDLGGASQREIQKPIDGTIRVAINGVEISNVDFEADYTNGKVTFSEPPATAAIITAGYEFEVPVRFDLERLDINLSTFHAGHIPSIPLLEIKPETSE